MDNLDNGLELLSGKLVVLFLTYALALEACANFPAGTRVKVTSDPNPDLNGEYTWDGTKLVKTTNNTLEKAKDEAEKIVDDKLETVLTPDKILDMLSGLITESELDQHLRQRIDKIESVAPIIEDLKREADAVKKDLDEQLFYLEVDYNNLKNIVNNLEFEIDTDFSGIKKDIQDLKDQVNSDFETTKNRIDQIQAEVDQKWIEIQADFEATKDRIDQIQKEVDEKWLEVDQIQVDLQKEINDRVAAVREETEARIADIRLLNDGLTKEIQERKDGDAKLLLNIENYKVSNDAALANVREEIKVAVDTSTATAEKVTALDARVKVAEDNSGKALENSAAAVSKAQAAADLSSATASRVDSLQADVVKAVDDSGKALTNSATAIQQAQVAVDKSNATANTVTILEANLNKKNSTYRQNTAPTKATHPNLTVGDIWINPAAKNEQKRWDGANWVDINDVRVGENATAISKMDATVKQQGDSIVAISTKVDSLETSIGDMATSEALEQLKSTVTQQGTDISANAGKITALETTVGNNQTANSKALQDLNVRVDKTDEKVSANASAITSLNSTVNASLNAVNITADLDLEHDITTLQPNSKGEITKTESSDGTSGRILKFGNNNGDDTVWMHPNTFLPFDPDVMYKVRAKIRRTANSGTGKTYIGIAAKNFDKSKYVTTTNTLADNMNSSAYLLAAATPAIGVWTEYEWYIKGHSAGAAILPPTNGAVDKPVQLQKLAGYISPLVVANYQAVAGELEVAYVVLETAESYKMISANANAITSLKTDVKKNGDDITAMAESITNVSTSLTNMDIGGQNLWSVYRKTLTGAANVSVTWLEDNQSDLPDERWGTASEEWYRATLITDTANYQHYFTSMMVDTRYPIIVGEDYTVSFEMRASKSLPILQVLAYFGDIGTIQAAGQKTNLEWTTYTFTAKSKGTQTVGSYQLFGFTLYKATGWAKDDWYEVRRVQLQKGNKATRYQKAQAGLNAGIKANSQAFTSLKTTVTQQGDTITAQGQLISGLDTRINNMDGVVKGQATAIDQLKTDVKEQGDTISANAQKVTALETKVDGNQSANSKALQDLNTRVDKTDGNVAANASSITSLNTTVNASLNAVNITADLDIDKDVTYLQKTGEVVKTESNDGTTQRVLRLGNNAGSDTVWMHPNTFLPFDPDMMYKVRAKIRRNFGTGSLYVGLACKNSDKSKYITTTNTVTNDMGSSTYLFVGTPANSPLGQWVELEFYIKGRAAGGAIIPPTTGTVDKPVQLSQLTGYFTPMVIANLAGATGTVDIAYVVLETAEAYKAISANANALTSLKTDVKKNGDDIIAMGEKIDNVEAGITNLDIGGQNLWSVYRKGLSQPQENAPYVDITWLEDKQGDPTTERWNTASEEWYRATFTKDTGFYQHFFSGMMFDASYPLAVGEDYTVSFEMRASKANKIAAVLAYFGANGTIIEAGQTTSLEWKVYTFTAKANGTATTGSGQLFGFNINKADGWTTNDWYEVRRVQLQRGDKATRFQKAQAGFIAGLKANAQAFTSLKATVEAQDGVIKSQAQSITGLETKVNGIDGETKANAKAIGELKTTVVEQGDAITSQGLAVQSLENSVKISAKGGANLLIKSNEVGTYNGVAYPHFVYKLGEDWEVGTQYTLIWCAEHKRGTGDTNSTLAVYAGGGSQVLQQIANTNGKVVNTVTFIKNSAVTNVRDLPFYMMNRPTAAMASVGTIYWAVLVKGPAALTDVWIPSAYDYIPQATANASAITGLQTDVKKNGDDIAIQASQLTGVKASLDSIGNDSLVRDYEVKTPSEWMSHYSNISVPQYFKTTTTGKVGNTVIRKDTTIKTDSGALTNLHFMYNLSNLPNDRSYRVTCWVRRSADSNGSYTFPVMLGRKGVWSTANYTSVAMTTAGLTPTSPQRPIPADGEWYLASVVVNMKSLMTAETPTDQIRIGISLGHVGSLGWSEMQAFKVQPIFGNGDTDGTIASSEAVQSLKTTVDQHGTDITAQGLALTGLDTRVKNVETGMEGQATAINELKTTVKTQGDTIIAQGQSITKVDARIDGLGTGNLNLISKDKWLNPAMTTVDQKDNYSFALKDNTSPFTGEFGRFGPFPDFVVGSYYVLSYKVKINDAIVTNMGGHINGFTAEKVLLDGVTIAGALYTSGTPVVIPNDSKFHIVTVIMKRTGVDTGVYIQPNRNTGFDKAYNVTVKEVMISEGNIQTGWSAPQDYFGDQIDATATGLTSLKTEVTRIDGVVKAQAIEISSVKASLNDKADASALSSLKVDVEKNARDISTQAIALTGLESNLRDVQASTGQNLIWNGDFTDGLNNWDQSGTGAGFTLYNWSARGIKWGRYTSSDTTTQFKGFSQLIPLSRGLKPNATYTLSFITHGAVASVGKTVQVIVHRITPAGNNQVSPPAGFDTPAGIGKGSFTFDTNGLNDLSALRVNFYVPTGFAPDFFISEVQVEEGKVATGYKKSNGEMIGGINASATAVTELKTLTKNQGDAITAQGTQITNINVRINDMEKDNLLNPFKDATNTGAQYLQLSIPLKAPITIRTGEKLSVRGKVSFEHPNPLTDSQGLAFYLEGSPRFASIPYLKQGPDQLFEGSLVVPEINNGRTIANFNVYLYPSGVGTATSKVTLHWAELYRGETILGGTASAVQSLNAKVEQQGGVITSTAQDVTQLKSSVNTLEGQMGNKVDASTLNNYYTKSQTDTAIAGRITEFSSSMLIGGDNVLINSEAPRTSTSEYLLYERSAELKAFYNQNVGQIVTASFELKSPVAGLYTVYASNGTAHTFSTSVTVKPADINKFIRYEVQFTPVVSASTPNAAGSTLEFYGGANSTGRIPTLQKVQLQAGNKANAWSPSPRDNVAALDTKIAANTTAIGKVETRTSTAEGKIVTMGTDISALQSKVNDPVKGIDASAIAMGKLDTRVTKTENDIISQSSALTQVESSLDGKIDTVDGKVDTVNGRVDTVDNKVNNLKLDRVTLPDTRTTNQNPQWYWTNYPASVVTEVKTTATIGAPANLGTPVTLETTVPTNSSTGGQIKQVAKGSDELNAVYRYSTSTTAWSPWKQYLKDIDDSNKANALATDKLTTRVGEVDGRVTSVADSVTQLDTKVGQNTASLQTQGQSIDGLKVRWSVKADVNGMVSGVAMNNDGKNADFIIRANTFAIAPPTTAGAGDVGKYAFVYQSTAKTLPNGTVVPAGLYVDSLMLGEINANRINATSLSAISANLGTLTTLKDPTKPNGARMVMTGSLITVYDDNNKMRVRLGLW